MRSWWDKLHRRRLSEPEDPVERLEAAYRDGRSAVPALENLVRLVAEDVGRLTPDGLRRLAACLVEERPQRYQPRHRRGAALEQLHTSLVYYDRLFGMLGVAVLEPMRWTVEQACGSDVPHPEWGHEDRVFVLPALAVIAEHGDDQDLCRLSSILANPHADPLLRIASGAAAAVQCRGESFVEPLLDVALEPEMLADDVMLAALVGAGSSALQALTRRLENEDEQVRRQAGEVLVRLRSTAVQYLMLYLYTADSAIGLQAAGDTLRQIAPERLIEVLRQRERLARAISRAEPPGADGERGVSRLDQ